MHDQAQTLRNLVRECVRPPRPAPRPAVLLVAGVKRGVGTTSMAANLAVAFQQLGRRTLLVDASPSGGDVALRCGVEAGPALWEVMTGRRTLDDAFRPGPGGIQILGGPQLQNAGPSLDDWFDPRWLAELPRVGPSTEMVVVDGGSGPNAATQAMWGVCDVALLVFAPDPASVINGYAILKLLRSAGEPTVYGLVNRAPDAATAGSVIGRIHRASRRFLGLEPRPAGFVPGDQAFAAPGPLVLSQTASAARDRLLRTACALGEALQAAEGDEDPVISCQERFNLEPESDRYTRTLSVAESPLDFAD